MTTDIIDALLQGITQIAAAADMRDLEYELSAAQAEIEKMRWKAANKPPDGWPCAEIAETVRAPFYGKRIKDGQWFVIELPPLPEPPHD